MSKYVLKNPTVDI